MKQAVCRRRLVVALWLGLAALGTLGAGPLPLQGHEPRSPAENDDAATPPAPIAAASSKEVQRPAWVDAAPDYSGPIHRIPVGSGPYATPQQARQALDQALQQQLAQYIATQLDDQRAGQVLTYPPAVIRQRWVPSDGLFEETVTTSVGPMHRAFARLELGPELRREMERQWRKVLSRRRLVQLGAAAGVVLGLLASVQLALGRSAPRRAWAPRLADGQGGEGPGRLPRPAVPIILVALVLGCVVSLFAAVGVAVWWYSLAQR
jgi:hypothetical protein